MFIHKRFWWQLKDVEFTLNNGWELLSQAFGFALELSSQSSGKWNMMDVDINTVHICYSFTETSQNSGLPTTLA